MRVFLATAASRWALLLARVRSERAGTAGAGAQRALHKALRSGFKTRGRRHRRVCRRSERGRTLFAMAPGVARLPASVEKLYTTATALLRFGPNGTLTTNVLGVGSRRLQRGLARHAVSEGRRRPDVRLGQLRSVRLRHRRDDAAARRQPAPPDRHHIRPGTDRRRRVLFRLAPRDAGHRRSGVRYVEGVLSGLAYDRGLANEQGRLSKPPRAVRRAAVRRGPARRRREGSEADARYTAGTARHSC